MSQRAAELANICFKGTDRTSIRLTTLSKHFSDFHIPNLCFSVVPMLAH